MKKEIRLQKLAAALCNFFTEASTVELRSIVLKEDGNRKENKFEKIIDAKERRNSIKYVTMDKLFTTLIGT